MVFLSLSLSFFYDELTNFPGKQEATEKITLFPIAREIEILSVQWNLITTKLEITNYLDRSKNGAKEASIKTNFIFSSKISKFHR